MINPGEIKWTYTRRMWARIGSDNVQAYEFHFTLRGEGDYVAIVPIQGFTKDLGKAAIEAVAEPLLATMDMYK